MQKKLGDVLIRSAEQSVVPKCGERPRGLRALIRSAAINARRWQDQGRARASSEDRVLACAAIVSAILVAFGLRAFRLEVSWDIFVDEPYYLQFSQAVLHTLWPVGPKGPFYLHPPGFFFVEAAYIKLFGISGDLIQQIYGVRYLGAALAGLSAGAFLWLGRRLAGWPAGIAAAAIFASEPFCIKMNSYNMLDTPTVLWVLLGYGVLVSALVRGEDHWAVSRRRTVAAGVLFGLALLTKEVSVFVTLLPLGICFVLGWALPRTRSALAGVVALIVYAPYLAIVYARGDWGDFVYQKSAGVSRLAGLVHVTGFNQQGGPSFLDAIISRLSEFATTYVLFATGAVAVCILLLTDVGRTPARRLLLSWTSGAYVFLAYAIVLGTLEEQFFYYLVIPCILATTVTAALLLEKMRARGAGRYPDGAVRRMHAVWLGRLALEAAAAVFVVVLVFWNAYVWFGVHTVPDNGYQRVASYVEELPEGSRVAVTNPTADLLKIANMRDRLYWRVRALRADSIDYVVIDSYLVTKGYKEPPPEVYRWVKSHGRLLYGFKDGNSSLLGVWQLQDRANRVTPAVEVAGGGGVVIPWLELAFLSLIAINLAVFLFLRQVQRQLLQNDHALLYKEKMLLRLWSPDRQRQQEAEM
jgi:4-amino-4-deoxy-L-arabinose transferase-like glycosyltransferase